MKKFLILVLAVTVIASFAAIAGAKILGTPHDLAPEPCAMCHTPHNGTGDYPLWNRIQDPQTYTMYDSTSFDMNEGFQPAAPSTLCLVCHNGVASTLSNYPGPCSTPDALYDYDMPDNACGMIGSGGTGPVHDLTNDHPIAFTYNPALDTVNDNNGFPDATTIGTRQWIIGAYSGEQYPLYANTNGIDQFECATCHSVHDTIDYPDKGSLQVYFLRADNTGSTMCQDCHVNR